MISFSFAENYAIANAIANVWDPITLTITVGDFNPNILTGGQDNRTYNILQGTSLTPMTPNDLMSVGFTGTPNAPIIMSGTSMSAPYVSGIILANNGIVNWSGYINGDKDLTPDKKAHR
jgi:subtilisin family serine protease